MCRPDSSLLTMDWSGEGMPMAFSADRKWGPASEYQIMDWSSPGIPSWMESVATKSRHDDWSTEEICVDWSMDGFPDAQVSPTRLLPFKNQNAQRFQNLYAEEAMGCDFLTKKHPCPGSVFDNQLMIDWGQEGLLMPVMKQDGKHRYYNCFPDAPIMKVTHFVDLDQVSFSGYHPVVCPRTVYNPSMFMSVGFSSYHPVVCPRPVYNLNPSTIMSNRQMSTHDTASHTQPCTIQRQKWRRARPRVQMSAGLRVLWHSPSPTRCL